MDGFCSGLGLRCLARALSSGIYIVRGVRPVRGRMLMMLAAGGSLADQGRRLRKRSLMHHRRPSVTLWGRAAPRLHQNAQARQGARGPQYAPDKFRSIG